MSAPLTEEMAPETLVTRWKPYPTTTTSSSFPDTASKEISMNPEEMAISFVSKPTEETTSKRAVAGTLQIEITGRIRRYALCTAQRYDRGPGNRSTGRIDLPAGNRTLLCKSKKPQQHRQCQHGELFQHSFHKQFSNDLCKSIRPIKLKDSRTIKRRSLHHDYINIAQ